MRVGLLIYDSLDTRSGGYLYDRNLADYLRNQGESVEILSLPWRDYPRHLFDNVKSSLLHKLINLKVDVLIQDELNHPSLFWLNHQLRPSYPILSLVHHLRCNELRPAWQNTIYRLVETRYLDSVNGFIFNSQTTHQSVDKISRIKTRPWAIATPGGDRFNPQVEAAEIKARSHQPGPLRLIFLGNLIPRKGLHTLVDALSQLPNGTFTLDVVGDTWADPAYTAAVHRRVESHGLRASIRFHGALDDDTLPTMLRNSHLMVVPSSYEGFGIVYLEGMGFGLPAISTAQGAASEIIIPGECGYLINPGDATALAEILGNLHQDRLKLVDLSLAARQRYLTFPGWEQSMARIHAFLTEITPNQS
jgi:glycosyltransferase involved in cell wall biosynthesis